MQPARQLGPSLWLAATLTACALSGCSTYVDHLQFERSEYFTGQFDAADKRVTSAMRFPGKNADMYKLEKAMIQLQTGHPAEAEQSLRQVRDSLDHLEQVSLSENAFSYLTDDTYRSYAGEDYEKVLLRAFLAISNLMHDGSDAAAYSLQVTEKQEQIIQAGADKDGENVKLAYKRVAFGSYLTAAMAEATHQNFDDATRNMVRVCSWEPSFTPGKFDLQRATTGHHSAPGDGVLYVFTLVGEGPYKIESEEIPSTVALLVADRIITAIGKHSLPPTIAPIKVPKVVVPVNTVSTVMVSADQRPQGYTATITDVGQLATQQYDAIFPQVMARAVVRRVVKKGVIYGAKEVGGVENHSLVNLAADVGGVIWEASESADTRCWGLLPNQIQVMRIELPAGTHDIGLRSSNGTIALGSEEHTSVEIHNGVNTYLLANFPGRQAVGKIQASK